MLRFLTSGESHGKALVGILEGMPSGLAVSEKYLHTELLRRKLGFGRGARQKIETDSVEILAGVRHGKTLGSPISLLLKNNDWKTWQEIMRIDEPTKEVSRKVEVPRPGHADFVGGVKYGHEDMRNVLERASARETAMRVALGTLARRFLEELGVGIASRVVEVGNIVDKSKLEMPIAKLNAHLDAQPLRCLSKEAETAMVSLIEKAKKDGDTLGGIFEVYADGLPLGLGSHVHWDRRIEGELAKAVMSLNAIKGVEIGLGFESARVPGSQAHDEMLPAPTQGRVLYASNRSGGIVGGMTTGQPLVVRAAMKPISTLMQPLRSVKLSTNEAESAHIERSDVCAVPAASVISESLVALVLANAVLEKFGGDTMTEVISRVEEWNASTRPQ